VAKERESMWRTLETAAVATAASLGLMGVFGYVLVRRQDKMFKAAVAGPTIALGPEPGPTPGPQPPPRPSTPEAPTTLPRPVQLTDVQIPLVPGRRYLAAVNVNFPLSLAASASAVKSQAEGMGFKDVSVTKGSPPSSVPVRVKLGADYYIVGTYDRNPASIGRSHASGRVEVLDAWVIG
jgi:hypothetical protein